LSEDGRVSRAPRRLGYLPPPTSAHDRWTMDARIIAQSGGLATVEMTFANQGLESSWRFSVAIEWQAGMEDCDVEARALALAAQSLRYLGQACADEATSRRY
jgi:hypothetical protein